MKTVIMAGGMGTRIMELFPDIPKPLIPIQSADGIEKPVLQWEIENLRDQGFKDIILTVSYHADQIINHFSNGSNLGVKIDYYVEEMPLGNAGALYKLDLKEDFLLLNADAVFDVDFNRMVTYHRQKGGLVTLFTHPNSHPYDSGIVLTNEDGAVKRWLTKEEPRPEFYRNKVNAGLHIISPGVLELSGVDASTIGMNGVKVDLDRQLLKPLCGTGKMFAYDSPEYVKDMGTPDRYFSVLRDFRNGTVEMKNLAHPQRAIFLDRDGTINKYVGFLRSAEDFELLDGVAEAIKAINASGCLAVVVTNQPVIARGEVTVSELNHIHDKMETELGRAGAYIDGLYYCPHHPHRGYAGEIPKLKIDCDCRKPKSGLLFRAAKDFNISLTDSWMVGDGENDVLAGKNAGCHTALISPTGINEGKADMVVTDLRDFVQRTLGQ